MKADNLLCKNCDLHLHMQFKLHFNCHRCVNRSVHIFKTYNGNEQKICNEQLVCVSIARTSNGRGNYPSNL